MQPTEHYRTFYITERVQRYTLHNALQFTPTGTYIQLQPVPADYLYNDPMQCMAADPTSATCGRPSSLLGRARPGAGRGSQPGVAAGSGFVVGSGAWMGRGGGSVTCSVAGGEI